MEKLDLTQILKDCPKGTKLYSPIFGEVEFYRIAKNRYFPIEAIVVKSGNYTEFTADGKYVADHEDGECMLFPSKDCRDWSTFKAEQPQFEPFEHVLVRDTIDGCWVNDFYAYFDTNRGLHQCVMHSARECLPFAGNEGLLGTTDEPKNGGIKGDFGTNGDEVVLPYNELQNKMKGE